MIHYYRYLFLKMKVFNYSELNFSELTPFKIHTLGFSTKLFNVAPLILPSCSVTWWQLRRGGGGAAAVLVGQCFLYGQFMPCPLKVRPI